MRLKYMLYYDVTESPFGPLWLIANQDGLSFVMREKAESEVLREVQSRTGLLPRKNPKCLHHWQTALRSYFSGESAPLKGPTSFMVGTPFQQKVWRTLLEIPYGQVRSYRWVADKLSLIGAARAVGNACGKNPLPIVIPCHRVIHQNGSLGGYTGGTRIKTKLLSIEGVCVNINSRKGKSMRTTGIQANQGGLC